MKPRRRWVVLVFLALALPACAKKTYKEVPDELLGVWRTPAPRYAGRFFELKKNSITIGTGESTSETFVVTKTEMLPEGDEKLYCVYFMGTDGDTQQWAFYLPATGKSSLRLKNQKSILWNKQG